MTYRDDVRRDPPLDVLLRLRVKLFLRDDDTGVFGWRGTLVPVRARDTHAQKKLHDTARTHFRTEQLGKLTMRLTVSVLKP